MIHFTCCITVSERLCFHRDKLADHHPNWTSIHPPIHKSALRFLRKHWKLVFHDWSDSLRMIMQGKGRLVIVKSHFSGCHLWKDLFCKVLNLPQSPFSWVSLTNISWSMKAEDQSSERMRGYCQTPKLTCKATIFPPWWRSRTNVRDSVWRKIFQPKIQETERRSWFNSGPILV
jgi:hypothetical protein